MTSRIMEKSMRRYLQLMAVLILSAVGGSANSGSDMNNSFNPYSSPTSGSLAASSSSSLSPSTSQTMFETYLQTFPINDTQNVLTTVHQLHHHVSTVEGEKEKTTASNEMMYSSSSSSITRLASLATEAPPSIDSQTPVAYPSLPSILTSTYNHDTEQPAIIEVPPHELLGCGPNNREAIGIQKVCIQLLHERISCFQLFHFFLSLKRHSIGCLKNVFLILDGKMTRIL